MNCPKCGHSKSSVIESEPTEKNVLRVRKCNKCEYKFETIETFDRTAIYEANRLHRIKQTKKKKQHKQE